jgi:hypothetical protein
MGILEAARSEWGVIRSAPWTFVILMSGSLTTAWVGATWLYRERLDMLNGTIARLERDLGETKSALVAANRITERARDSGVSTVKAMDMPTTQLTAATPSATSKGYIDLRAEYSKLTDIQGRALVERHRGRSFTIQGKISNVSAFGDTGAAMAGIMTPQGIVVCTFPAPLDPRVIGLRKDDPITVTGKLDGMKGYGTDLIGCVAE